MANIGLINTTFPLTFWGKYAKVEGLVQAVFVGPLALLGYMAPGIVL